MLNFKKKEQVGSDENDFKCVLLYNNKKIAIYSMGDYANHLKEAFVGYSGLGCDYLICAIRTGVMQEKSFAPPERMKQFTLKKEKNDEEQLALVANVLSSLKEL